MTATGWRAEWFGNARRSPVRAGRRAGADPGSHFLLDHRRGRSCKVGLYASFSDGGRDCLRGRAAGHDFGGHRRHGPAHGHALVKEHGAAVSAGDYARWWASSRS